MNWPSKSASILHFRVYLLPPTGQPQNRISSHTVSVLIFLFLLHLIGIDGRHEHGAAPAIWDAGDPQEVSLQGRMLLPLHIRHHLLQWRVTNG